MGKSPVSVWSLDILSAWQQDKFLTNTVLLKIFLFSSAKNNVLEYQLKFKVSVRHALLNDVQTGSSSDNFDQATDEQKERMQVETQALKTEVSLHKFTSKQSYLVMHVHNNRTLAGKEGTKRAGNFYFFLRRRRM